MQAVVSGRQPIGLLLNLVLMTNGLWLVWVFHRALNREVDRVVITVDRFGDLQLG